MKFEKNLPPGFDKSADLLRKRQNCEEDFFKLCVFLKKSEFYHILAAKWVFASYCLLNYCEERKSWACLKPGHFEVGFFPPTDFFQNFVHKKLEIKKTKPTIVISVLKVEIAIVS